MRPTRFLVPALGAVFVLCAVAGSAGAADSTLQSDVNALRDAGNVGVIAESNDRGQVTTAKAGVAQVGTTTPVPDGAHYRAGSITKTFVAATVLHLVGEGRLSLDDTVDRWLPGVVNRNGNDGTKITVRMLLQHTSGLFDYDSDPRFTDTLITAEGFYANRYRHYDPADLINMALDHPPNFAPGASWDYTNTGYIVIGEIIRSVTGNTWDVELTNRILRPQGLTETYIPGDDPTIVRSHANGYAIYTNSVQQRVYSDVTEHNMTWGGSAGALITTTSDSHRFFTALLSGRILQPAQLTAMKTTVKVSDITSYGLGIVRTKMGCSNGELWWHNGGTMGYTSWAGTNTNATTAFGMNQTTMSFTDTVFISRNDARTDPLIKHVFCGPRYSGTESLTAEMNKVTGTKPLR